MPFEAPPSTTEDVIFVLAVGGLRYMNDKVEGFLGYAPGELLQTAPGGGDGGSAPGETLSVAPWSRTSHSFGSSTTERVGELTRSSIVRTRPLWLITRHDNGRTEVLTIDAGGEVLPVFSFEEEAETFLRLGAPDTGWRARETSAGEIISVLYGPCTGAKKVALDPLPTINGEALLDLVSLDRERFMWILINERGLSAPHQSPPRGPLYVNPSKDGKGGVMRESGREREWTEDGSVRRKPGTEDSHEAEDIAIPDYVIRDFGVSEESRDGSDGRHRASAVSETGEELA